MVLYKWSVCIQEKWRVDIASYSFCFFDVQNAFWQTTGLGAQSQQSNT